MKSIAFSGDGGGSSGATSNRAKGLPHGAGEIQPLSQKGNFQPCPHPMAARFAAAISLAIDICSDAGLHTADMAPILEKDAAWCRQPYQNPEDNEPGGEK